MVLRDPAAFPTRGRLRSSDTALSLVMKIDVGRRFTSVMQRHYDSLPFSGRQ